MTQPSTSGALFSITPASFSSQTSPASSGSGESLTPAVSDASTPGDTISGDTTTPVGAADTGDGSYSLSGFHEPGATRDHIGEALVGLGGLGLAAGAGMAGTAVHRRRQRV